MPSDEFLNLLNQSIEIHKQKSQDYANEKNPLQNFDRQIQLMDWFSDDADKCFVGIIAQKMARLAELSEPGRTPQNESIEDTELDALTYMGLWFAFRRRNRNGLKEAEEMYNKVLRG